MLRGARGEALTLSAQPGALPTQVATTARQPRALHDTLKADDERGYGYDVQYVVRGADLNVDQVRVDIAAMGDSMVVVGDAKRVKVHIHVHDPGVPISYGIKLGVISDVVVENMQDQFEGYVERRAVVVADSSQAAEIEIGVDDIVVIAVAPGEGLGRVFKDTGAAAVISGGQSANPSVGDFLQAMEPYQTGKFVLLPNNKNVVLTAELAAKRASEGGRQVEVIPTTSVPQGLAAMYAFNPQGDLHAVAGDMRQAYPIITTGEVTLATRSVDLDGVAVREGQYIGLANGKLVVADDELQPLLASLLEHMKVSEAEIITLYYGEKISERAAGDMAAWLSDRFSADGLPEFHIHYGGQPLYQYILSAE
jgi:uncharacterized protein